MYHFFALINRMKNINRWGLMRNTSTENIQEHSQQTAVLAHALAVIAQNRLGNTEVNPEKAALIALYHDATEIITGDMPTPIKYHNDEIKKCYNIIEKQTSESLLNKLPEDLKHIYKKIFNAEDTEEWIYVKAADTLSAYIKCIEEIKVGNNEFRSAMNTIKIKLENIKISVPALTIFMDEFLESYFLTLDEQSIYDE
ncbi:MAG: metal dependent phosphohydrolase [Clostridia bacterium]|jgi:5'-deoxynucleotidase|nr:metal dependent phosphohydrolase [Clostridia bacterium]